MSQYFFRYINLPKIPKKILDKINYNFEEYKTQINEGNGLYIWSESFNVEINKWCRENICSNATFAFQIIRANLPMHIDYVSKVKFHYILDAGGDKVTTNFYDSDAKTLLESVVLKEHSWHILKVDGYHDVTGIENNRTRFAITALLF